jgi:signal transduction histidine kinase
MALGPPQIRRAATGVALAFTGLVAVAIGVGLGIVDLGALRTHAPDGESLISFLRAANRQPGLLERQLSFPVRPGKPYGGRRLIWIVDRTGQVVRTGGAPPDLPAQYRAQGGLTTAVLDGHRYFLAGEPWNDGWLVAGTGDEGVVTVGLGQLLTPQLPYVAPALAGAFLVSLLIGRWAAQPIERARQRQLAFTADASHELRTPLAVVEGEVSLALSRPRTVDEYRAALERVSRETLGLRRLVDDLLWLARFEAEPRRPDAGRVSLADVAERAVERFRAPAAARDQRLELFVDGDAVVLAPYEWLDRLLGVLLDNACKYAPVAGRVCVTVRRAGRAELLVDDSGPGIPPAERELVFERFHRAAGGEGAGLGLAIGSAIVRSTRGEWIVDTSPLGGARVGVWWPHA